MKLYERENIEILSVHKFPFGSSEIQFRPIVGSIYYCPGANVGEDAGRRKVSFVRCGINEKCSVDAVAEMLDQGKLRVVIPSAPENIDLVFSDGVDRLAK